MRSQDDKTSPLPVTPGRRFPRVADLCAQRAEPWLPRLSSGASHGKTAPKRWTGSERNSLAAISSWSVRSQWAWFVGRRAAASPVSVWSAVPQRRPQAPRRVGAGSVTMKTIAVGSAPAEDGLGVMHWVVDSIELAMPPSVATAMAMAFWLYVLRIARQKRHESVELAKTTRNEDIP